MLTESFALFALFCALQGLLVVKAGDLLTAVLVRQTKRSGSTVSVPKSIPAF